ncbi:hypothetical protein B0H16DRAFT_1743911 [Mycena metata]|uniref:Uncharacterized protein n=1 Tax=Mycena metata TaxID=1033252 RepID=A0AAD7MEF3_9AGAR|nr:hypothetical protein B0H16DRAFT_1743911 [Mycena metata]
MATMQTLKAESSRHLLLIVLLAGTDTTTFRILRWMTLLQLMDDETPPIRTDRRVFEKMVPDFIRRLCKSNNISHKQAVVQQKLAGQVNPVLDERKAKKMFLKLALQLNTNWNNTIQARNSSLDPDSQEQRQEEVVRRQRIADVAAEDGTEPSRGGQDWRRLSGLFLSTNNYQSVPLSRTDDPEQRVLHLLCKLSRPKARVAYEELEKVAQRLYQSNNFRASCFQSNSTIPILFKYLTAECEDTYNALGIKHLQWIHSSNGHNYDTGHYIQTLVGRMLREHNARPQYQVSWIGHSKKLSNVRPKERLAIDRVQQHRCLLQEVANAELNIVKMKSEVYRKNINIELTSLDGGTGDQRSLDFIHNFRQIVLTPIRDILDTCAKGIGSAVDDAVVNRWSVDESIGKMQAQSQEKGYNADEGIGQRMNSQVNELDEFYNLEKPNSESKTLRHQAVERIFTDLATMKGAVGRMMADFAQNTNELTRRAANIKAHILHPSDEPQANTEQPRGYGRLALFYAYSRLTIIHGIAVKVIPSEQLERIFTVFSCLIALLSWHPMVFVLKDTMDKVLEDHYSTNTEINALLNAMRGFMTSAVMCIILLSKSYYAPSTSTKIRGWMSKSLDPEPELAEWDAGDSVKKQRTDAHGQCQNPRCEKTNRAMDLPDNEVNRIFLDDTALPGCCKIQRDLGRMLQRSWSDFVSTNAVEQCWDLWLDSMILMLQILYDPIYDPYDPD